MRNRKKVLAVLATILLVFAACHKDYLDQGPIAIKTKDFLTSKDYKSLEVEIAYVEGHRPTDGAINRTLDMLRERLNKPEGVNVTYKQVSSPRMSSYTLGDLRDVEKNERDIFSRHGKLTAFIFFADAPYAQNSGILGVAYGTTSIAVFETQVENYSGGLAQASQEVLEATVMEHEFGHLFGLVDNGTPMTTPHMDAANPSHCINDKCLMYYAVETIDITGNLTGGTVPGFDADCIADLRAYGGK